jgi:RNA polymerase sigma-70 factor (ECF subfamily)
MDHIRCRRDEAAFETLTSRYRGPLLRHLISTVRDGAAADDLLQETLLRVWTRADQWDGRGAVKAWLFRIATNLALNHLRTVRRRKEQPLEATGAADPFAEADELPAPEWLTDRVTPGPDALAERADRAARLRRLVERLPDDKREALRLVYDAEMDVRGAADTLGIPEGTVKSRLHYARRRLAEQWRRDIGEEP